MEQLTNLIVSDRELVLISNTLLKLMNDTSASSVMLIDKSGQVITTQGMSTKHIATSLGALLAGPRAHSPLRVMLPSCLARRISAPFFSRACMKISIRP